MSHCFVCGEPVFGIDGIDAHLDTYMLDAGPDSEKIVESGSFGDCHLVCLPISKTGTGWARILKKHFVENLGYEISEERGAVSILKSGKSKEFVFIRNDGPYYLLAASEVLAFLESCEESLVVHRRRVQRAAVQRDPQFDDWFRHAVQSVKGVGLRDIFQKLQIGSNDASIPYPFDGTLVHRAGMALNSAEHESFDGEVELDYFFAISCLE